FKFIGLEESGDSRGWLGPAGWAGGGGGGGCLDRAGGRWVAGRRYPRSMALSVPLYIPSPPINGFHLGALYIHFYGLMYVIAITLAVIITRRRWRAVGGDPSLLTDVATWAVPAGIIGGGGYFDIKTPFATRRRQVWGGAGPGWDGGLGVWGGIAAGAAVGIWRV